MSFFSSPTSFRLNALQPALGPPFVPMMHSTLPGNSSYDAMMSMIDAAQTLQPTEEHPSLTHLALLVFEAVMEVVCVSLPGYIIARAGLFDTENQKFVANLNVSLFTPCLSECSTCPPDRSGFRKCVDGPEIKFSSSWRVSSHSQSWLSWPLFRSCSSS